MEHGTPSGYNNHGCRCQECKDAYRAYRRAWRAKHRNLRSSVYQRELLASWAVKESYRGTCRECGAKTTGCHGPGLAPTICAPCNGRITGIRRRGTGETQQRVLALLSGREMRYMELVEASGLTKGHMAVLLGRLRRYGFVERPRRGVYRLSSDVDATITDQLAA